MMLPFFSAVPRLALWKVTGVARTRLNDNAAFLCRDEEMCLNMIVFYSLVVDCSLEMNEE